MREVLHLLPVRVGNRLVGKVFINSERLFVLPNKKKYDNELLTHAIKKANKLFGIPPRDSTRKRRKRRKHSTVEREIGGEVVLVDKGIVDLVDCVNSLDGVRTRFSCEGYRSVWGSSYVSFECRNTKKLFIFLECSQRFGRIDLSYYDGFLTYGLYIHRKSDIRKLVKTLGA